MSYEQKIGDATVYIAEAAREDMTHKGYDLLTSDGRIDYHWSANVFLSDGKEYVREVAFHTADNNVPYEVYVNKLGRARPSNPGTPATPLASGIMAYAGYHTVELSSPVDIEAGEYFSVIVKLGTASAYEYATAVEDAGTLRAASINAGESYFAKAESKPAESDWKDGMSIQDTSSGAYRACNACIKVFMYSGEKENTPELPKPITDSDDKNSGENGGGGGGGCSAASLPAISVMLLAFAVSMKKH